MRVLGRVTVGRLGVHSLSLRTEKAVADQANDFTESSLVKPRTYWRSLTGAWMVDAYRSTDSYTAE